MTEWGRKQYRGWAWEWAWTQSAGFVLLLAFLGGLYLQYQYGWTTLQQYYLFTYVKTWAWPPTPAKEYTAIYVATSGTDHDGDPSGRGVAEPMPGPLGQRGEGADPGDPPGAARGADA
jgi:hypothetical protein